MDGEAIFARSLSAAGKKDKFGNFWQYHPQSDRHSKIACWAILFDLLQNCSLLREHAVSGKVSFGINHEMRDFKQDRKKDLDLVLCTRRDEASSLSFTEYGRNCGVILTSAEADKLSKLPVLCRATVTNVLIALEAKACMTEHSKAVPRLHDELSSSHQTIHGDTGGAIAAGFVLINCAGTFVSPGRNKKRIRNGKYSVSSHVQPAAAEKMAAAVMKIPRRKDDNDVGFDAVGISMIRCANDGSPIAIDEVANENLSEIAKYDYFVHRLAHLYATKYGNI